MKFTKKRGYAHTWHAKAGGMVFKIYISAGRYILYVRMKNGGTYSGLEHSGIAHSTLDEAKAFAELIRSGEYDWAADIKTWERQQAERKAEHEAKIRTEADSFICTVHSYGMSIGAFLELNDAFDYMNGDVKQLIYQSAENSHTDKGDNNDG